MRQNLYLNTLLSKGAILGLIMLCSHIFEQCAVIYGGTMVWLSAMGFEMLAMAVVYVWLLYRFAKSFSLAVVQEQSGVKMFSYGRGFSFVVSVSALAGVIVGLGRYIMHSIVIGHKAYVEAMVKTMHSALSSNPGSAALMSSYEPILRQLQTQPEPGIFATIFSAVWSYMMWGIIVGLIVAAIVKVEPKLFDENNTAE